MRVDKFMQPSDFLTGSDRGSEHHRSPLEYRYLVATQIFGSVPVLPKKALEGFAIEASYNVYAHY